MGEFSCADCGVWQQNETQKVKFPEQQARVNNLTVELGSCGILARLSGRKRELEHSKIPNAMLQLNINTAYLIRSSEATAQCTTGPTVYETQAVAQNHEKNSSKPLAVLFCNAPGFENSQTNIYDQPATSPSEEEPPEILAELDDNAAA
jgi:hypothetical protein